MANKWETAPIVGGQSQPEPQQPAWASAPVVEEGAAPKTTYDLAADKLGQWSAGPLIGAQIEGLKRLGLIDEQQASGIPRKVRSTFSLGFDDEIMGGAAALGGQNDPDQVRSAERRALKDYEAAHPGQALAVGVGANLATLPLLPAKAYQGATLGTRMLKGAGVGGGYGFATGFGGGEGETAAEGFGNRLQEGLGSGLTGAAFGGATVPVAETIGKVVGAVAQPLKGYLMPTKVANDKLLEALSRDQGGKQVLQQAGKTATKRLMADADTMVADLGGENTQGLIKQAMRMPNAQREVFKTKLDARQARQVSRLSDELGKKLGSPEKYEDKIAGLLDRRTREARPAFNAAFAKPAVVSPENKAKMASLLSTPTGTKLMERAVRFAQDEQQALQTMSSTKIIHIVKMQADDILNGLKNRREGLGAWDFNRVAKFKRELLNLVENDTYKSALKQFSDTTKIKIAGERGFRHGFREDAGAIADAMRKMSPPERDAYRLGLGKWIVTKIRSGNRMNDRVRRDFMDKNFMDKMRLALGGQPWKGGSKKLLPTEYRELQRMLGVKGRQADTRRFLQGGSDTSRNLMEAENASQAAQNMTMLAKGLVDPSKIGEFMGRQYSRLTGMTPGVANALLKRAGQQANRANYNPRLGPRTMDDIDRAIAALQAGKPLKDINAKYRDIVKALIASEGYLAGSSE